MSAEIAPSPRTAQHPMAFRPGEFWRGALTALGSYTAIIVLVPMVVAIIAGAPSQAISVSYVSLIIGGPAALVVMLVLWPLAWILGLALRRVRAMVVHIMAFAVLGGVVGLAGISGYVLVSGGWLSGSLAWLLVYAAPAVIAVPLGWWITARRALRADRGLLVLRRARRDEDADYEDAL